PSPAVYLPAPSARAGARHSFPTRRSSDLLHGLPSLVHAVPEGLFASAGQLGPFPGQFSAGSHSPAEARHTVLDGLKASAGQTVSSAVHTSELQHRAAAVCRPVPACTTGRE